MDFDKYRTRGAYHYDWYKTNKFNYRDCVDKCVEFCKGSTLDLGCGEGVVVGLLEENGIEATGIEIEQSAVDLADPQLDIRQGSVYDSFMGKWEYMVSLNVIEHLEHPEAIKQIFENNISKAAIIITDIPQLLLSRYHVHEFTPEELKDMFSEYKTKSFKIGKDFHGIEVYK